LSTIFVILLVGDAERRTKLCHLLHREDFLTIALLVFVAVDVELDAALRGDIDTHVIGREDALNPTFSVQLDELSHGLTITLLAGGLHSPRAALSKWA
jgi:hypothetical protein